jgi:hypothetical protein
VLSLTTGFLRIVPALNTSLCVTGSPLSNETVSATVCHSDCKEKFFLDQGFPVLTPTLSLCNRKASVLFESFFFSNLKGFALTGTPPSSQFNNSVAIVPEGGFNLNSWPLVGLQFSMTNFSRVTVSNFLGNSSHIFNIGSNSDGSVSIRNFHGKCLELSPELVLCKHQQNFSSPAKRLTKHQCPFH